MPATQTARAAYIAAYLADENVVALCAILGNDPEQSASDMWDTRIAARATLAGEVDAADLSALQTQRVFAAFDKDDCLAAGREAVAEIARERRMGFAHGVDARDCPKCSGRGHLNGYEHVCGGVCFKCGGCGKVAA